MQKLLYINDYACDTKAWTDVIEKKYPANHFWGMTNLLKGVQDISPAFNRYRGGGDNQWFTCLHLTCTQMVQI